MHGGALLLVLDHLGVAIFAARGALAASSRGADPTATVFLAAVAAVGGGTTRDVLIGAPVFWLAEPSYLIVAAVIAIAVWCLGVWSALALAMELLDAVGLGTYAVAGTLKALMFHVGAPAAVVVGVIAATWGGMMREVLAGETTVLARRDVYVTASLVGSVGLVALMRWGCNSPSRHTWRAQRARRCAPRRSFGNSRCPAPAGTSSGNRDA